MLSIKFQADSQLIKQQKKAKIHQSNMRENNKRTPHEYKVKDKVLYLTHTKIKYADNPYKGPYCNDRSPNSPVSSQSRDCEVNPSCVQLALGSRITTIGYKLTLYFVFLFRTELNLNCEIKLN